MSRGRKRLLSRRQGAGLTLLFLGQGGQRSLNQLYQGPGPAPASGVIGKYHHRTSQPNAHVPVKAGEKTGELNQLIGWSMARKTALRQALLLQKTGLPGFSFFPAFALVTASSHGPNLGCAQWILLAKLLMPSTIGTASEGSP